MGILDGLNRNSDFGAIGISLAETLNDLFKRSEDGMPHDEYVHELERVASGAAIAALGSVMALQCFEMASKGPDGGSDNALKGLKSVLALQAIIGAARETGIVGGDFSTGTISRTKYIELMDRVRPIVNEAK